jgi:hypothetical protein
MGYFVGGSSYEISTDNRMRVRVVQPGNPFLAWYHILRQQLHPAAAPTDYTI